MPRIRLRGRTERWLATRRTWLLVLVLIWPDWIEVLFDEAPGNGDDTFGWGLVVPVALSTMVFATITSFVARLPAGSNR